MSDSSERPEAEPASPPSPSSPVRSEANGARGPEAQGSRPTPGSAEFLEALKRDVANNRLTWDQIQEFLVELPPLEERERLYRELQENGGLSFEEFCASLGIDPEPQP
jgi:hypothetical protein